MIPFSEIGLAPIIYRFYNILEKNMIPVYDSARRQCDDGDFCMQE